MYPTMTHENALKLIAASSQTHQSYITSNMSYNPNNTGTFPIFNTIMNLNTQPHTAPILHLDTNATITNSVHNTTPNIHFDQLIAAP